MCDSTRDDFHGGATGCNESQCMPLMTRQRHSYDRASSGNRSSAIADSNGIRHRLRNDEMQSLEGSTNGDTDKGGTEIKLNMKDNDNPSSNMTDADMESNWDVVTMADVTFSGDQRPGCCLVVSVMTKVGEMLQPRLMGRLGEVPSTWTLKAVIEKR